MKENTVILERLARLRSVMAKKHMDYCLIPTADHHASEYVADHFKAREYFCGFTGSNGTLVVGNSWAGLWTDGRYFIQAEKELAGTGVELFRMADEGVPTINEYLAEHMRQGETLGFDGRAVTVRLGESLAEDLKDKEIRISCEEDPAGLAWPERPPLPCHPVFLISDDLAGLSASEKMKQVREKLSEKKANALLLTSLEDICWLFNFRGDDVACTPVALCYAYLAENSATLFIQSGEITEEAAEAFGAADVEIRNYEEILSFLKTRNYQGETILYDRQHLSFALLQVLKERAEATGGSLVAGQNPTLLLKAIKNETELEKLREVYIRDSAQLTKFLYWVKTNAGKLPMDEVTAAEKLDGMRALLPGFIELSFPTISAFGENAAMMHYEATPEDHAQIRPDGLYLVDSGGTYQGGTTDVTRTLVLGEVSGEVREHFTAVVRGMLRLAGCRFIEGCTGRNLDILAREPVWELDMDYKCGTGHGVGYMLSVHEGPHNIRWRQLEGETETPIHPGMIVSDEPGIYLAGRYGIRIENILEVTRGAKNGDGQFLGFEHLTWVPIDLDGIDVSFLEERERRWLNEYHAGVRERILPLIEEEEIRAWVMEATREV